MCHNPILEEWKDDSLIPKMGTWESAWTLKISEFNCRGQNTSHWGVLYIIRKLSKCRCWKWPHMSHLDICSTSYDQKRGRESNWQFDSQPLKVRNRPDLGVCSRVRHTVGKLSTRATTLLQTSLWSKVFTGSYAL